MKQYRTNEHLIYENDQPTLYNNFANKELPFAWSTTWAYTQSDDSTVMLTSKNVKYTDGKSRLTQITLQNTAGKEVYSSEEYLLVNETGDESFKNIDIGCFENFFAIIYLYDDRIAGESVKNFGLKAFDYEGALIGNFKPDALMFAYYTPQGIEKLKCDVNSKMTQNTFEQEQPTA